MRFWGRSRSDTASVSLYPSAVGRQSHCLVHGHRELDEIGDLLAKAIVIHGLRSFQQVNSLLVHVLKECMDNGLRLWKPNVAILSFLADNQLGTVHLWARRKIPGSCSCTQL